MEDEETITTDMTVAHDPSHPDYDAHLSHKFTTPRISPSRRESVGEKHSDQTLKDCRKSRERVAPRSLGSSGGLVQFTVSAEHQYVGFSETGRMSNLGTDGTGSELGMESGSGSRFRSSKRSASLDDSSVNVGGNNGGFHSAGLSESWPGAPPKKLPSQRKSVDLSLLSEKTRKLIGTANVARYSQPGDGRARTPPVHDGDLGLSEVVQRLNQAAARSREGSRSQSRSREPSIEKIMTASSMEGESLKSLLLCQKMSISEKSKQDFVRICMHFVNADCIIL